MSGKIFFKLKIKFEYKNFKYFRKNNKELKKNKKHILKSWEIKRVTHSCKDDAKADK